MDLIINQVMQFQVVHVSDRSRTIEVFTCTSVAELYFTGTADRNAFPESTMVKVLPYLHNHLQAPVYPGYRSRPRHRIPVWKR